MEKRFYFKKLRDVQSPSKSYELAAGWDFYIPNSFAKLSGIKDILPEVADWESKTIMPGQALFIPSGLQIKMQENWFLSFQNKSGIAIKGLVVGATVVDPDYQGEVHLHLWNVSKDYITVKSGQKIAQAIFFEIPNIQLHEISAEEQLYSTTSHRGTKGFGSSQKNNK